MTVFNFPDTTGQPIDGSFTWTAPSGVLYVWNGEAWVTQGSGGSSGGGSKVYVTDDLTTIADPEIGDLAYHTVEARLYVYYQDSDSQQWVDASPAGDANDAGGGIDDAPSDGQLYGRQDGEWEVVTGGGGGDSSGSGADAWGYVNSDGTLGGGFNCTTEKTTTGQYKVTFTTPMPNASYAVTFGVRQNRTARVLSQTATEFVYVSYDFDSNQTDGDINFAVFASNTIAPEAGVGADAWGLFASADGKLVNGFNFGSATKTTTGRYTVPFITAMPNASYAAVVTPASGSARINATLNQTETQIEVWIRDQDGNSIDSSFSLVVHASSTITPTYTWTRNGTTLEPANDGDDVVTAGGNIKLNADGTGEFRGQKDSGGLFQIAQINNGPDKCQYEFAPTSFYFGNGLTKNGGGVGAGITLNADGTADFGPNNYKTQIRVGGSGVTRAPYIILNKDAAESNVTGIQFKANGSQVGQIKYNGSTTFFLEPENPANFTAEGEYIGPTLDVKDRLLNLISRLDALEANEVIDDATDTSLLTLLANASSRLDSIEARLTALEGGN